MKPNAYVLLERAIEEGLAGYLLNRVNKYQRSVMWCEQREVDGPVFVITDLDREEKHIRRIVDEAVAHLMNNVCDVFIFDDDSIGRTDDE